MQLFRDLGSLVEQRWRDRNYDEEVFPDIAAEALAEAAPSERVNPWDIIRWLNTATHLPEQRDVDGKFGDPPITLYDGSRFYIDVYFWLDGTTTIHQHAFCGAFQVLLGSSILSQYRFEEDRRINAHFSVGRIDLNGVELLEKGDIRHILPGRKYIHSLFHLDRPSATIIIRTRHTPTGSPQYSYHKPHFAIDPFFKSAALIKRVQGASLLLGMRHPESDDLIGELLSCSDFQTAFAILDLAYNHFGGDHLERAFGLSGGRARLEALFEIARRRHGDLVDLILPVLDEARRQNSLVQRRGQITSNEHRFFLALLLNVPDRSRVLDMVRRRFPEREPADVITDWVYELANTKVMGSAEPNVMGIDDFDDTYLLVFECLLEGLDLVQTKARVEQEYSAGQTEVAASRTEQLYNAIRDSIPFKSIFTGPPVSAGGRVAGSATGK